MLNEDWFAMQDAVGTDVLICRPGFNTFALQTHVFCWSFVSTCADDFCPTSSDHRKCNNGLSIASAACSIELDHPGACHKEQHIRTKILRTMRAISLRSLMLCTSASNSNRQVVCWSSSSTANHWYLHRGHKCSAGALFPVAPWNETQLKRAAAATTGNAPSRPTLLGGMLPAQRMRRSSTHHKTMMRTTSA